MSNPWEEISLNDYENHMSLDSVKQGSISDGESKSGKNRY
jgi:hypothetical protein